MTASRTGSRSAASHAEIGQRARPRPGGNRPDPVRHGLRGGLPERVGQPPQRAGRTVGHERDRARQHHGVGLRMRGSQHRHHRLAAGVVHRQPGRAHGVAAQHAAQRQVLAVRPVGSQRREEQRRGAQRRAFGHGVGHGAYSASIACASAFMAVAASVSRGAEAISAGSHTASAGRTSRSPRTPAGMRWKGVNVEPASVVGIAAQPCPRPRPDRLGGVHDPAAAERHDGPSGHVVQQRGRRARAPAGRHVQLRRRRVQRAVGDLCRRRARWSAAPIAAEAGSRAAAGASRDHARAEADQPLAVAEGERRLALVYRREPARWSRPARGGRPPRTA